MSEQHNKDTRPRHALSALEKARRYRKWNLLTAFVGMIVIVWLYITAANRASYSDNIGVFVVPLVVFFMDGPAISAFAGIVQTLRMLGIARAEGRSGFSMFLETQPRALMVLGSIGIVGLILTVIKFGLFGLMLPFFPFWPIKYLF